MRFACTVKSFFGLFPRRFRRAANNARLSCATRRARGDSNVRDGCEASSAVHRRRVALKTRASKSPSLVWRVTPRGCGHAFAPAL